MKRLFSKKIMFVASLTAAGVFGSALRAVAQEPIDYNDYTHYLAAYFESDPEIYAQILSYLNDYEGASFDQMDGETDSDPAEDAKAAGTAATAGTAGDTKTAETAADTGMNADGNEGTGDDADADAQAEQSGYGSEGSVTEELSEDAMEDLGPGYEARSNIVLYRDLQNGITGDDVKSVQERLAAFGYDVGPVDGVFGPRTEAAVLKFQTDHGLYVDGIIGNISIGVINSIDDGTGADTSSLDPASVSGEFVLSRDLSYGSQGNDVSEIQRILESLGYSVGVVDGIFGNYTKAAVQKFQEDHGLYVDGVIGPLTAGQISTLIGGNSQSASRSSRSAAAAPAGVSPAAGASTSAAQLTWLEGSEMNGAIELDRTLNQGMSGSDVSSLQQRLFDLGYLQFSPDGNFDSRTEAAVEAFQKDHGLVVDGWVGSQTLSALNWRHFLEEPVVSPLADSASISEKCYSREGNDVRFIIPHHMAGRMSGENCAQYFTYNDAGTSANYCIGYGGDIAQNVPEQYGAWTSGDVNFDRQAITIEVSDTSASDYTIPEAAQESLVDLCVDIVKRNPSLGGRLVYDPSDEARVIAAKNGTGSWDAIKGNVLLHRWTTTVGTDCPGWHMTSIMPNLVERVNNKLQQTR